MTSSVMITIKLGGAMVQFAPKGQSGNTHKLALQTSKSVQAVLDELQIPQEQPLMIILNDAMVARTETSTTLLLDGDKLSLMPPIKAG